MRRTGRSLRVDGDESWSRWRTVSRVAALSAAALVVGGTGLEVGRITSVASPRPASVAPDSASSLPAAHSAPTGGAPGGFPETAAGARAAAMTFVQIEAGALMAHPDAYRAAWQQMCTADYYAAEGRAIAETVLAEQEAVNHLVSNTAAGQRVYERAVPLTAVVSAMDSSTATVRTWSLLIAHPGDGPTVASFAAGVMRLRWEGGGWRLDGGAGLSSPDDGTSGLLELSAGPALPGYLANDAESSDAPTR